MMNVLRSTPNNVHTRTVQKPKENFKSILNYVYTMYVKLACVYQNCMDCVFHILGLCRWLQKLFICWEKGHIPDYLHAKGKNVDLNTSLLYTSPYTSLLTLHYWINYFVVWITVHLPLSRQCLDQTSNGCLTKNI